MPTKRKAASAQSSATIGFTAASEGGRAELTRRVRLWRKQPNQCNLTTRQHRHIDAHGHP